jgi:SNF2 family DNA or RNA helicase
LIKPEMLESWYNFRDRTMVPVSSFKYAPRRGSEREVFRLLQPCVRFSRDDCLDLPDCVVETRSVPLTKEQEEAYQTLRRDAKAQVAGGDITAVNEAVLRLKLIQIACGAVYDAKKTVHHLDCKPRYDALDEVIEQAGGKVLVFAPLTSVVDVLERHLSKNYTTARITGATGTADRGNIIREFQHSPNPRVLVADPGCMAHGVTLTEANCIIWFGPTDRPELYDQANARINRPGQRRKMLIVRLASTPIEKEIFRRLHEKASLQGAILELVERSE